MRCSVCNGKLHQPAAEVNEQQAVVTLATATGFCSLTSARLRLLALHTYYTSTVVWSSSDAMCLQQFRVLVVTPVTARLYIAALCAREQPGNQQ